MQQINRKRVEKRTCTVCKRRYTPRWEEQQSCGGSCARSLSSQRVGYPAAFAKEVQRRKAQKKREIEAVCHRRWPELSVREIEIFNFAVQLGYRRGYNRGYAEMKRKYSRRTSEAAA